MNSNIREKCLKNLSVYRLFGAIAGDIIGSDYEFRGIKSTRFTLFPQYADYTDDTILTIATAYKLLNNTSYSSAYREFALKYPSPKGSYGNGFRNWVFKPGAPAYNSFGNGSAMRVSPAAYVHSSLADTLKEAKESAEATHNHPEGIKGAQATAGAVYIARTGGSKNDIREFIVKETGYNLSESCDIIRLYYSFNETAQNTVPQSITAFLESTDYENAIRLTVSLGGDADTMGAITGAIAESFYGGVPESIAAKTMEKLPDELLKIVYEFNMKFLVNK